MTGWVGGIRSLQSNSSFSSDDKIGPLQPGSVKEHDDGTKTPTSGNVFEAHLDILVDVRQIDSKSEAIKDSFIEDFSNMFISKEMSDVILTCGDKEFPCHRLVRACRSKFFRAMFFADGDFKEKKTGRVALNDFHPDVVEQFLNFVYGRKCDFGKTDPWTLLEMADMYDMGTPCSKVRKTYTFLHLVLSSVILLVLL